MESSTNTPHSLLAALCFTIAGLSPLISKAQETADRLDVGDILFGPSEFESIKESVLSKFSGISGKVVVALRYSQSNQVDAVCISKVFKKNGTNELEMENLVHVGWKLTFANSNVEVSESISINEMETKEIHKKIWEMVTDSIPNSQRVNLRKMKGLHNEIKYVLLSSKFGSNDQYLYGCLLINPIANSDTGKLSKVIDQLLARKPE